ncbi:RsmE family RNA methyltransferase [Planctomyces sp. SH-PL62]|uniref:RsmE family RNA methyltransferase n=1 Tax=Planctomyces sp. SH-PL62 TaxID=1636152 RepID=UPI00078D8B44|nr:RsmE family RNA methyltransferase [Planctomyces sp. SH-PL62]AMV36962.1 Ribosomal RNA small subunit methyltransferase E [Planctomyces sp. SH-PL62]
MSQRFYCPQPPTDGRYRLDPDESRHLTRVCRRGVGDLVELFDGRGFATAARVVVAGKDAVQLEAEGEPIVSPLPSCSIEVGSAVPKGDRFDWLVEKAVELGVDRIVPLVTERSVVDPRGSKLERLRRTIVEASKQSGRSRLMELAPPEALPGFLRRPEGLRLLADPSGAPFDAWPAIQSGSTVRLVVGPEGGLTDEEVASAREAGWVPVRLASPILRIETAVLAGAASILARTQPVH